MHERNHGADHDASQQAGGEHTENGGDGNDKLPAIAAPHPISQDAWNEWRTALEQAQRAASRLVNHVNARGADAPRGDAPPAA